MKAIRTILGTGRKDQPVSVEYVSSKKEANPQNCILPPPSTVKNPFSDPTRDVSVVLPEIGEADLKQAIFNNLAFAQKSKKPGLGVPDTFGNKLPALSRDVLALVTPRRNEDDLKYHRPQKLSYGNAYRMDPRQVRLHGYFTDMLNPSTFETYSKTHAHDDFKAENEDKFVDLFEFFTILEGHDLLRRRQLDIAVIELRAIARADAMRIFRNESRSRKEKGAGKLDMSAFHQAVIQIADILEVPLDGKPMIRKKQRNVAPFIERKPCGEISKGKIGMKEWKSPFQVRTQEQVLKEKLGKLEIIGPATKVKATGP
eukprot:CAMPEP_0184306304 /NCGR_PEP_ID=MMETSP1049-20130417/15334_1 /TAXON_ID=77928 /ORGANISM="Proteomonas sulcata, Strain CCMP704" /LENGTH=313 /DNA_ID=CAMNT_0026618535 /DNA_START=1 /DNA_END=942 /DNA_ORIENTATION=+